METKQNFVFASGRRKRATARVRLYPVKDDLTIDGQTLVRGAILVNGRSADEYFKSLFYAKNKYAEVFRCTNAANKFVTTVLVEGSGLAGQLDAVCLGIARALVKHDKENKAILRKKGYMTRDPREVERKKPGLPKARKQKSSPKR
jgi:small subunit ribosomal protein S9